MDRQLKILHIVNRVGNGGSESGTINLARGQAHFHHVRVVGIKPPLKTNQDIAGALIKLLEQDGVGYHELNFSNLPPRLFVAAFRLKSIIQSFEPDIVHLHTDHPEYLFAIIKPWVKCLVVRTIRNTVFWPTSTYRGRFTERRITDAVTVHFDHDNIASLNRRRAEFGLKPPTTIEVIPNAINRHCETNSAEAPVQYHEGFVNLGYIGRLSYQKGPDILFQALEQLPANTVVLHVIGDGEDKQKLMKMAESIQQEIIFYGAVPFARQYIKVFDYLVVPSRYEGFGLVSLEAQLEKTPVIAARSPGLLNSLPEDWPLLFDNENSKQLAELLTRLIDGQDDYTETVKTGYENALNYTMEAQVRRYTDLYLRYL